MAYCAMPDQRHLVLWPNGGDHLSRFMHRLEGASPFLAKVAHRPLARDDDANAHRVRLACSRHAADDAVAIARRAGHDEADTHVERPVHLVATDTAAILDELKEGRHGP